MKISGTGILFCENTDYYSLIKAIRSNQTEEYDSHRKMTKEQSSGKWLPVFQQILLHFERTDNRTSTDGLQTEARKRGVVSFDGVCVVVTEKSAKTQHQKGRTRNRKAPDPEGNICTHRRKSRRRKRKLKTRADDPK